MKKTFKHIFCSAIAITAFGMTTLFASPGLKNSAAKQKPVAFIENKGQVRDQDNQPRVDIQFRLAATGGLNIFIGNGAIRYQFSKDEHPEYRPSAEDIGKGRLDSHPTTFNMDRMDVELLNANKNAKIVTDQKIGYHENYFTQRTGEKGTTALAYKRITYKDIYPNIDWVLYVSNGQLKHEFLVRAGGKVSDIKLKYGGAKDLKLNNDGSLTASTVLGEVTEQAPVSFEKSGKKVSSSFLLNGEVLSYQTGEYSGDLVIDPTLAWATYFGGSLTDYANEVASDAAGNLYMVGYSESTSGIATSGSHQTTMGGGLCDAYLAKFNSAGDMQWATYYGGAGIDVGNNVAVDVAGSNVCIVGHCNSTSGISTTGTQQTLIGGGLYDAFVAKFNSSGILQWATYCGGTGDDYGNGVAFDASGRVGIVGTTSSTIGIASGSVTQPSYGGGASDAFLVVYNGTNGIRISGTYCGGAGTDMGEAVITDASTTFFIAGGTNSSSAISSGSVYQPALAGDYDAFWARYNFAGTKFIGSYFGGSGFDIATGIALDPTGHPCITGYTASTSGVASVSAHQLTYGGGTEDGFLAKFTNSGALTWSSYYGGSDFDWARTVAIDAGGNVYLAGTTASTTGIATSGSHQDIYGGGSYDAFLASFNSAGVRQYGTYYGGSGDDQGSGIALDGTPNIYMTGFTFSTSDISTTGSHQAAYGGGPYDGFLVRFDHCIPPIVTAITGGTLVCPGGTAFVGNTTVGGTWSSSNTAVATAGSVTSTTGVVSGVALGTAIISYTVSNACGTTSVRTRTVVGINSISTVAGTGLTPGYLGDGGAATTALLNHPHGVTSDGAGNIYIADKINNVIRKVNPAGVISTIAGTGVAGAGADGVAATSSALTAPFSVTLDAGGNIYFSEPAPNHRIRMVNTSGIISTVAGTTGVAGSLGDGGAATAAQLNNPAGIAFDADGNMYVADRSNNRVRVIAPDGTITNFAGTGTAGFTGFGTPATAAQLSSPNYLAIAPSGNVIITDNGNHKIRSVDLSGIITTVVGSNSVVAGGFADGLATAATVRLWSPCGIAFDPMGNLFIADSNNHRIRMVANLGTPGASISTYAGFNAGFAGDGGIVSTARFNGPADVAFDPDWRLLIADNNNNVIRRIAPVAPPPVAPVSGVSPICQGIPALFTDATVGGSWSSSNTSVAKVGAQSGFVIGTAAGTAIITYGVNTSCGTNAATMPVTINPFTGGAIVGQTNICVGNSVTLTDTLSGGTWSSANPSIASITAGGVLTGVALGSTAISYTVTTGCGPVSSTAWITVGNPIITTIGGGGGIFGDGVPATTVILSSPTTVYVDGAGNKYITEHTAHRVRKIDPSGIITTIAGDGTAGYTGDGIAATATRLNGPSGVCMDAAGNIYIAEQLGNRVRKINTSGIISTIAGTGVFGVSVSGSVATASTLAAPTNVIVDDVTGDIYVAEFNGGAVSKIDPSGTILRVAGGGSSTSDIMPATALNIGQPYGISLDGLGNLFIAEQGRAVVRKVDLATGLATIFAGTLFSAGFSGDGGPAIAAQMNQPNGVYADPYSVYIAEVNGSKVRKVDRSSGIITSYAGTGAQSYSGDGGAPATAVLNRPAGVILDNKGDVYIADYTNGRIRQVTMVDSPVAAISGLSTLCEGATISLTDATPGGSWSSSNGAVAMVGTSGVVTGIGGGTADISYSVTYACGVVSVVKTVTVDPLPATPAAISGPSTVCTGAAITLTNATTGGTWTSTATGIATIGSGSGIVSGIAAGTTTISYTISNSCGITAATVVVTVTISAGSITGSSVVCVGGSTTLTGLPGGGSWSSSSPGVASVGSGTGIVNGVTAGTATITYTNTGGCFVVHPMTIDPLPGAITGSGAVCQGATTPLSATGGGTWTSGTTSVATVGSSTGIVSGVTPGTSVITYALSTGCAVTTTITVNANPAAITPSGPVSFCAGATQTLANATIGGSWSSSPTGIATVGTSGVVLGIATGNATISYTLATGCFTIKPVTVNTSPVAMVPLSAAVCAGSTTTFTNAVGGGTWSSSASGTASVAGGVVTGVSAGTATISYTIGTCFATAPVTVNAVPAVITPAVVPGICAGATTTLANATPGGTWSSGSTVIATVGTSGIVTGVSAGTATISYTTAAGCSATKNITVNTSPAGVLPSSASVCTGNTVTLTDAVGGGVWSSSSPGVATAAGGVVTGVTVGTATISYSIGTCFSTASVTVNLSPNAGTITGPSSLCIGTPASFTTTATGGAWSSSDISVATVSSGGLVSGVGVGAATISYSVTNGCGTAVATAPITVNAAAFAGTVIGLTMMCAGTSTTLVNATPGGVWSASNGNASISSTGILTAITPGIDTIYYTVINACGSASARHIVTIGLFLTAGTISGPTDVCAGSSITLTDPAPGGTWSASNTNATVSSGGIVTGVSGGTVTISYTVVASCGSASATHLVTVTPIPDAGVISGPWILCAGMTDTYTTTGSGGVWSVTNPTASITSGGVVTAVTPGSDTIRYTVVNMCGTSIARTGLIIGPAISAGSISGPSNVCPGVTITLTDAAPGGVWSASNSNATVSGGGVVTGVSAGTVTISYTVTSSCGSVSATTTVTVDPLPAASTITGPSDVCVGATITLANATPGGVWSASNANATVSSGGVVIGVSVGTVDISYTVTTACGAASAISTVTVSNTPVAGSITGLGIVCESASITLTATTPGGTWSASNTNATVSSGGVVAGITAGTVTISYTVSGSCGTASATAVITVNPLPNAGAITGPTDVCVGSMITLTDLVSGGVWSASNTNATVSGGLVTGVTAGTVTISYTVTNSCGTATAISITTVNPLPDAGAIIGGTNVCIGTTLTLTDAAPGGTWSASNGNATVTGGIVTGVTTGMDTISYTVSNSCGIATASVVVTIGSLPTVAAITGPSTVCKGASISLADATAGGVWTASNARATVTATGLVTGVTAGLDTIRYTVTNACGAASAMKIITISQAPSAGSIVGASNVCAGLTITLSATAPGGTWSSSSSATASVSGAGVVSGIAPGSATISYAVSNGCGSRSATHAVSVLSHADCNTMVNGHGNTNTSELKVYPNPNQGAFTMNLLSDNDEQVTVMITNIIGVKIKEFTTTTNKVNEIRLNTAPGIYLLTAITANGRYITKVTVE